MDNKINKYIEKQQSPQKEIIQKVREIFLKTLPKCKERFAWGVVVFGDEVLYWFNEKSCAYWFCYQWSVIRRNQIV